MAVTQAHPVSTQCGRGACSVYWEAMAVEVWICAPICPLVRLPNIPLFWTLL